MSLHPVQWLLAFILAVGLHIGVLALVIWAWSPSPTVHPPSQRIDVSLSGLGSSPETASTQAIPDTTTGPTPSASNQAGTPAPTHVETASTQVPESPDHSNLAAQQVENVSSVQATSDTPEAKNPQPAQPPQTNDTPSIPVRNAHATTHADDARAAQKAGARAHTMPDYKSALSTAIAQKRNYPQSAREHDLQGHVEVRAVIGRAGQLKRATIMESSGHRALDQAALAAVKNAAPFAAMPSRLQRTQIAVREPFDFELSR